MCVSRLLRADIVLCAFKGADGDAVGLPVLYNLRSCPQRRVWPLVSSVALIYPLHLSCVALLIGNCQCGFVDNVLNRIVNLIFRKFVRSSV